jgi:hypothetical protein
LKTKPDTITKIQKTCKKPLQKTLFKTQSQTETLIKEETQFCKGVPTVALAVCGRAWILFESRKKSKSENCL